MISIVPANMLYRITPAPETRIILFEITVKCWYHYLDDYTLPNGELRRFLLLILEKAGSDSGLFFEVLPSASEFSPVPLLFEKLYELMDDPSPAAQLESGHLLSLIMLRLQREEDYKMGYTKPLSRETYFVQRIYKEIMDDIRDITLEDLAARMGLSYGYMCRKFKKETGDTIHKAITKVRMDMARTYLRQPEIPVSLIADILGYIDETNFIRNFKKYHGLTPAKYRRTYNLGEHGS